MNTQFTKNSRSMTMIRWSFRTVLLAAMGIGGGGAVWAQGTNEAAAKGQRTGTAPAEKAIVAPAAPVLPVLTEYKGVAIGTNVDTVRERLGHLREKGVHQDFFVFSDDETAQIFYDDNGLVRAISVDFKGDLAKAPAPEAVLGMAVTPRADGSLYKQISYPAMGYWIAYSRTPGTNAIVTVTMQRM